MVVDHLSCLNLEPFNDLPIIDSFLDEQLLAISSELWFADIVNYLVTGKILPEWTGSNRIDTNSCPKSSSSIGMIRISLSTVLTRSLGDAFQTKKLGVFYLFAMIRLVEVILGLRRQLPRCFNVDFTSPLCLRMLLNTVRVVIGVNSWVRSQEGI